MPFYARYHQREPGPSYNGMDIDQPEPPNLQAQLSRFALQSEEGPARKRPHSDIETRAFQLHPASPAIHLNQNTTPWLFAATNVPPAPPVQPPQRPFSSYEDEYRGWKVSTFGVEDVEMKEAESPARPSHSTKAVETREEVAGSEAPAASVSSTRVDERLEGEGADETDDRSAKSDTRNTSGSRPFATGAVTRVRRKREKEWRRRRESDGADGDHRSVRSQPSRDGPLKTEHTYNLHMNSPSMRHSEIPALLLGYLQFFVNASIVIFVLYLAVQLVLTVRRDVRDRMSEASVEILQEISECTQLYLANRCDPVYRVPAMEAACKAWDACMKRDPTMFGRTNVIVETFAGVINSFVDTISWKTMGFTLVTLSFLIILTNSALFNLRQRVQPDPTPAPPMYPPLHQAPWMLNGPHTPSGPGPHHHHHHQYPPQWNHQVADTKASPAAIGWPAEQPKKKGWW